MLKEYFQRVGYSTKSDKEPIFEQKVYRHIPLAAILRLPLSSSNTNEEGRL